MTIITRKEDRYRREYAAEVAADSVDSKIVKRNAKLENQLGVKMIVQGQVKKLLISSINTAKSKADKFYLGYIAFRIIYSLYARSFFISKMQDKHERNKRNG